VQTVEHPRRPLRLEGGELVSHPGARGADCVVWFPVPDAQEGAPEAEGIPARRLDGDRARLCGIPFFPYHAGFGDEVQIRELDGTIYAVEVVVATSDLVVRVFDEVSGLVDLETAMADPGADEPFWRMARALAPHGCWFERYTTNYAALLVPADEWEYVRPFLELKARVENIGWELATPMRTAHD